MVKARRRLSEPETQYFMLQIIEGVRYLHANNIIHRDLKLGNLFVAHDMTIRIGDFGLAAQLSHSGERKRTVCGTPNYIAPEVIDKESSGHSFEVDVWSLGVILYTMLIGRPPFETSDVKTTYARIRENTYSFPDRCPVSDRAKDIIRQMLQPLPAARPSLEDIVRHPFFTHASVFIPTRLSPTSLTASVPLDRLDMEAGAEAVRKVWAQPTGGLTRPVRRKDRAAVTDENAAKAAGGGGGERTAEPTKSRPPAEASLPRRALAERVTNRMEEPTAAEPPLPPPTVPVREVRAAPSAAPIPPRPGPTPKPAVEAPVPEKPAPQISQASQRPARLSSLAALAAEPSHTARARLAQVAPEAPVPAPAEESRDFEGSRPSSRSRSRPSPSEEAGERASWESRPGLAAARTPATSARRGPLHTPDTVQQMHARLRARLLSPAVTSAEGVPSVPPAIPESPGPEAALENPDLWVASWVDYTSKYGLGYLLSNGSVGVYFNDSTKMVLASDGRTVEYIERSVRSADGRREPERQRMTLEDYPEELKKKITLLQHFQGYLMERHEKRPTRCPEEDAAMSRGSPTVDMPFVKKWVRTSHAVLFRLSNRVVQMNFFDHSSLVLSSDARNVSFVDKRGKRSHHPLSMVMQSGRQDIAKRLRYTKDILHQVIEGTRR